MTARPRDVAPARRAALDAGRAESATLAEGLAVDFAALMGAVAPDLAGAAQARIRRGDGITRRMAAAAALLLEAEGPGAVDRLAAHPSDTVRGWAAYLLAAVPDMPLQARLARSRPLADDPHFAVREWAWLAQRPHIAAAPRAAIAALSPWVHAASPRLRRFAVEATRPRGVWSRHIASLKADPEPGRELLDPLRAEADRYPADSVGNWLNNAARSRPDWVRALAARWRDESPVAETDRILRRALRSL